MNNNKIYVKNSKMFKSRSQMIIYIIVFCVLIYLFIFIGTRDYSSELTDNELIAQDFSLLDSNNIYEYTNATKVRSLISNSAIVLFGTNNNWVDYYMSIVNEAALNVGIDKIYYYDFVSNREDNNATYEDIVDRLSNYVTYDDTGEGNIYAPTLVVVIDGEVIYYDSDTSLMSGTVTPEIYYTDLTKGLKETELEVVFTTYLERTSK